MSFLVVVLVLCILNDRARMAMAWEDEDFFRNCPPSRCSQYGPEIRYPFQLESSNKSSLCGAPCMKLACSGKDTILVNSALAAYKVTTIDYRHGTLTITPPVNLSSCHLIEKLNSASVRYKGFFYDEQPNTCYTPYYHAAVVRCSRKFTPRSPDVMDIARPIPCLSNNTHLSYLVAAFADMSILPLDCKVASDGMIPMLDVMLDSSIDYRKKFKERAERIINVAEMSVYWPDYGSTAYSCTKCERHGRRCAFSSQMNETFCMHHGMASKIPVVALL